MAQMNPSTNKLMDLKNRLVFAKGEGGGWIGSVGVADVN